MSNLIDTIARGLLEAIRNRLPAALVNDRLDVNVGNTVGLTSAELRATALNTENLITVAPGHAVEGQCARLFSSRVANGGAVNFVDGEYVLTTTGANGSTAIHIGNVHGFYRPGFRIRPAMTVAIDAPDTTNVRIEWGGFGGVASSATSLLAADACGYYVENGVFGVFYRNSLEGAFPDNTHDFPVAQWNGQAPIGLDDLPYLYLYYPELLWYGAADIKWYIRGTLVHRVDFGDNDNRSDLPYMRVPHLRLGVLVHNLGAAVATTVKFNCGSVHSIGGGRIENGTGGPEYRSGAVARAATISCGAVTRVPVMALRMSSATRAARGLLTSFLAENAGAQDAEFEVFVGRDGDGITLTGASWTAVDGAPLAEYDVSSTAVTLDLTKARSVTEGGYVDSGGGSPQAVKIDLTNVSTELGESFGPDGDGTSRIFVITARSVTATTSVRIRRAGIRILGYG